MKIVYGDYRVGGVYGENDDKMPGVCFTKIRWLLYRPTKHVLHNTTLRRINQSAEEMDTAGWPLYFKPRSTYRKDILIEWAELE